MDFLRKKFLANVGNCERNLSTCDGHAIINQLHRIKHLKYLKLSMMREWDMEYLNALVKMKIERLNFSHELTGPLSFHLPKIFSTYDDDVRYKKVIFFSE